MQIELNELANVKGIGKKTIQRIRQYKLADEGYVSKYDESLHLEKNSINNGDCLELMNGIPDKSIDMILADLPYGTTACSWDSVINLDKLWLQYERIIKDNGAIVLTASQPFTTELINSNKQLFRYEWIWKKAVGSNFGAVKYQPMKEHESVLVFSKETHKYFPILEERKGSGAERMKYAHNCKLKTKFMGGMRKNQENKFYNENKRNPSSVQFFNNREKSRGLHPTQKPVALFEYLIKTYTNKNDTVLDNVSGSGTTAVACINTDRNYICIEQDKEYYEKSLERIQCEQ